MILNLSFPIQNNNIANSLQAGNKAMHTSSANNELSNTQAIQKLLFEAYKHQNLQYYDDALENLQGASEQLIRIIESMQKSPQFYMKVMPIMKQERELVLEHQYKEFWSKNQKVLCRNFQKNAYRALIMQQLKEREIRQLQKMHGAIEQQENPLSKNPHTTSKKSKLPLPDKKKPKPLQSMQQEKNADLQDNLQDNLKNGQEGVMQCQEKSKKKGKKF